MPETYETANEIFASLTENFELPDVADLNDPSFNYEPDEDSQLFDNFEKIELAQLTENDTDGNGIFDSLMQCVSKHIEKEYDKGRIVGKEYSDLYLGVMQNVLSSSIQLLLTKNTAQWEANKAQLEAQAFDIKVVEARVQLENAKNTASKNAVEAQTASAQFALAKMGVATADAQYNLILAQENLVEEQIESERAKTLDTRSDGASVNGSVGKQKELYTQQIDSFIKDAKQKTAKMYLDGWITQKTLDEGLANPNELDVPSVSQVLLSLRNENGL